MDDTSSCNKIMISNIMLRKHQSFSELKEEEQAGVAVEAWQSITREDTQPLVMSNNHQPQAVIACKGYATKY